MGPGGNVVPVRLDHTSLTGPFLGGILRPAVLAEKAS